MNPLEDYKVLQVSNKLMENIYLANKDKKELFKGIG
jgi:hypothetical protein